LEVAQKVALISKLSVLFGSEEINPYHWIVVEPDGSHRNVFVDVERLDKHNEFVIECDAD